VSDEVGFSEPKKERKKMPGESYAISQGSRCHHRNKPHIYTEDNTSHIGEEVEVHLSPQEWLEMPERTGNGKHPQEPHQMLILDSDRPSCKQRGRVFLTMLQKTQHGILNDRFELKTHPLHARCSKMKKPP